MCFLEQEQGDICDPTPTAGWDSCCFLFAVDGCPIHCKMYSNHPPVEEERRNGSKRGVQHLKCQEGPLPQGSEEHRSKCM